MISKELILKKLNKIEDKLLVSKILDKAAKAEKSRDMSYSDFLDPYQKNVIEKALTGNEDLDYTFTGGYPGAERVIIVFRPNFMPEYVDYDEFESPLKLLDISLNTRANLSHRDYLGALMSLGIKREKIGDILVKDDSCSIIVICEIADYIKYNLEKVANVRISLEIKDIDEIETQEPKVREINTTVASLRLDCISSAGFGISRSKIADFIKAEKVNVNWETSSSLTKQLKEGDTISIKGKGRVILETVGRVTKKGRIGVILKKLV